MSESYRSGVCLHICIAVKHLDIFPWYLGWTRTKISGLNFGKKNLGQQRRSVHLHMDMHTKARKDLLKSEDIYIVRTLVA